MYLQFSRRGLQPRSCYIPCEGLGNAQYWARLNPESFKEDNEKDLEVTFAVVCLPAPSFVSSWLRMFAGRIRIFLLS